MILECMCRIDSFKRNVPTQMSHQPHFFHALIPCAGSGSRMGVGIPKQYFPLAGSPLVVHTLRAFEAVPQLGMGVTVVAADDVFMDEAIKQSLGSRFKVFNTGGATRAQSVLAGLLALKSMGAGEQDWVMVHDAARCLITPTLILHLYESCQHDEVGGLLALPLADTLKVHVEGRVKATLSRDDKWLAQTPQMFRWELLFNALKQAHLVTDESSAVEQLGLSPQLVTGASFNFKVTYPEDIVLAQAILADRINKGSYCDEGN